MGFEKYFLRSMINFLLTRTNNTKCRRKIQSHFIKKNLIFSLNLVSYVGMDGSLKGGGVPVDSDPIIIFHSVKMEWVTIKPMNLLPPRGPRGGG